MVATIRSGLVLEQQPAICAASGKANQRVDAGKPRAGEPKGNPIRVPANGNVCAPIPQANRSRTVLATGDLALKVPKGKVVILYLDGKAANAR